MKVLTHDKHRERRLFLIGLIIMFVPRRAFWSIDIPSEKMFSI